jgi:hypothetical protein
MNQKEEFQQKLAHFNAVKAEVEAFVTRGGDLKSAEAATLGAKFLAAANDMWVAGGGKPFLSVDATAGTENK